jgi:hypothetical protein
VPYPPFCANPNCRLHVSPGDANVHGFGHWAVSAEGIITGRRQVGSLVLCDISAARQTEVQSLNEPFTPLNGARSSNTSNTVD